MTVSNQTNEFSHRWLLDSDVVFLNHGSFGATPRVVLDQQTRIRLQIEREPLIFFDHDYLPALDHAGAASCASREEKRVIAALDHHLRVQLQYVLI